MADSFLVFKGITAWQGTEFSDPAHLFAACFVSVYRAALNAWPGDPEFAGHSLRTHGAVWTGH